MQMNTKDEIVDIMDGYEPIGSPPPVLFTQTGTLELMQSCGVFWPEANFDARKMAELALQPSKVLGFATARIPFSVSAEAEAIGCFINPGRKNSQPYVTGSPWRVNENVDPFDGSIPSIDEFMSHPRIVMMTEAAEILSRKDLFVTSMCDSPTMVASHVLGMENMLMGMMIDLNAVREWIDAFVPHICAMAHEMSTLCDNIMIISDLSTDITIPDLIDHLVENNRKILSSIKDSFTTIHNCGDTIRTIDQIASLGADMVSLETSSNHEEYVEKCKGKMRLMGGVNTVRTLLNLQPSDVRRECLNAAELGFSLIAPECGVPPQTPNANLRALSEYRCV